MNKKITTMKRLTLLSAILSCLLLLSCGSSSNNVPQHFDYAAENLPFARPTIQLDSLPSTTAIPQAAHKIISWRRAFFSHDFVMLDAAINKAHDGYVEGKDKTNLADDLINDIEQTGLAGIDACKDWLVAMPASYGAHWVCGAMWQAGAWAARSHQYSNEITPVRFALMHERLTHSNALLEKAITLSTKPVEAMTVLAQNHFMAGADESANVLLQQAQAIMPTYGPLHETRIVYALPEWGGSDELVTKAIAEATQAGVDEDWLLNFYDSFVMRPTKMSDPGAERAYWEQAIEQHPTRHRLKSLTDYFLRNQNLHDSIPVATRLIKEYPGYAPGYPLRAYANQLLGNTPAALADYRMAAALGNNYAANILIQAHINGGLGLTAKSWQALDKVCRYGATLGSPAAANCMGAMFWEGNSVGEPFHTDIPQAFAWHLFAARAGHFNSQYDLGWLLLTNRAPNVGPEQAKANGLFWLRRAAEQGHQFARKKLEESGYDVSEVMQDENGFMNRMREISGQAQ